MSPLELQAHRERVRGDWLDYNGHLNEAYYLLIFSHSTDHLMDQIGLDHTAPERRTVNSLYTLETHICYLEECGEGAEVEVTVQLLDWDERRLHYFHEMRATESGRLLATAEMMALHVDMSGPRAAPFPAEVRDRLEAVWAAQKDLPKPKQAGRTIGIRR